MVRAVGFELGIGKPKKRFAKERVWKKISKNKGWPRTQRPIHPPQQMYPMKLVPSLSIVTISALALTLGASRLQAAQPEMNDAIEQLEMAKHDAHPIEHLEKAKHHLEEAEHNKGGERVKAIGQINMAIEDARKVERHRMEEHIEAALVEIREGKHDAR